MTTCVVVKKNGQIAIASDSLVTFGDTCLSHAYEVNNKIFPVGESYITLASMGEDCKLNHRPAYCRNRHSCRRRVRQEFCHAVAHSHC